MRGAGKAADAAAKGLDKKVNMDKMMDSVGEGAVAKAAVGNAKKAFSESRANGGSIGEAAKAAGSKAIGVASGAELDQTDAHVNDEDTSKMNGVNQSAKALQAKSAAKQANGDAATSRQMRRQLTDKTALLTSQESEFTEALEQHGAAVVAEAASGSGVTNGEALRQASTNLSQATGNYDQVRAQREEHESKMTTDLETLEKARSEFNEKKAQIQEQVQNGSMTKPEARQALNVAGRKVQEARKAVAQNESLMTTLVSSETKAENRVRQAQGAVKMTQDAVDARGADAKFETPSNVSTTSETARHVEETHRQLVKTNREVQNLINKSENVTSNTSVSSSSSLTNNTSVANNNTVTNNNMVNSNSTVANSVTHNNVVNTIDRSKDVVSKLTSIESMSVETATKNTSKYLQMNKTLTPDAHNRLIDRHDGQNNE